MKRLANFVDLHGLREVSLSFEELHGVSRNFTESCGVRRNS